ncbi:MAG: cadmium-translocating P-type ATPase [Clostridia bacterium]|nr:cadmium-translocating P-type ATPase [Clostridia bacterium]
MSHEHNCTKKDCDAHHHDHDHGHEHEHGEGENRTFIIIKLIVSAVLFAAALVCEHVFDLNTVSLILCISAFIAAGTDVIIEAVKEIFHKNPFNECLLMSVASIGAILTKNYMEAAAVMILYNLGELLQDIAVDKSRDSIMDLIDIVPKKAEVLRDGNIVEIPASEIREGDIMTVKPGRNVPADGVIIKGASSFDTSALTGESYPRDLGEGDEVISGFLALDGEITVMATAGYDNSAAVRIRSLIEGAEARKAKTESFISKFAKIYTPVVVGAAVVIAVIPPLFDSQWSEWIHRALTFLVTSCPCALVISVPLTFFAGIGAASKKGILIKGAEHMEVLSKTRIYAFDKTGTLTKGTFRVSKINAVNDEKELINTACSAERHSDHPLAKAVCRLEHEISETKDLTEIPGYGVTCVIDEEICAVGNAKLMRRYGIEADQSRTTAVHVCRGGRYLGSIEVEDEIKDNAKEAVKELGSLGAEKTVMLSGDTENTAAAVAELIGINDVKAQLLPENKVDEIELLTKEGIVTYVGDGMNDAAVLARADVGISMGALGSDAAIEAADIVLTDDNIGKLPKAVKICKKTVRIAWQNIIFAIAVKAAVLVLSAVGVPNMMWLAVFADTGVALLCAANALRAMK